MTTRETIGEDILVLRRPLGVVGMPLGKTSSIIRHPDGRCLIHSAANFSAEDVATIRDWGEVGWLLEATCMHDTFARKLRAAFPDVPYGLPAGFPIKTTALSPTWRLPKMPAEWDGLLEVLPIRGIPRLNEFAMLHRPSRTLLLGDLVFNLSFPPPQRVPLLLRWISGLTAFPGTSRLLRFMVKDRGALAASIEDMLSRDFERVLCSHGETITADAKTTLRGALAWALPAG